MGLSLMSKEINLPSTPDGFAFDIPNLNSIKTYAEKITAAADTVNVQRGFFLTAKNL